MLITFEGADGTGKSSQIDRLYIRLKQMGLLVTRTAEPYVIHKDLELHYYDPLGQLFLFQADRTLHCRCMKEWLDAGLIVLCDRFTASTIAYQGYGHGIDLALIHTLNAASTQGLKPDLTIWLDMPADKARSRAKGDRLDGYDVAFYERVREGYGRHFASSGENVVSVCADQSPDEVESRIWAVVGGMLPRVMVKA